jgi:hypothetical protein
MLQGTLKPSGDGSVVWPNDDSSYKISCAPPKMQTLALGAVPTRFSVPQLQGQKRRNKMYQNRVHLIGYLGKNPEHKTAKMVVVKQRA